MTRTGKKLLAAVGTLALAASVAAGCGGDSVSADEYVGNVCTAFDDFATTVVDSVTELQTATSTTTDPEAAKEQITTVLNDAADASNELSSDLDDAGTPDVDNGEDVADTISEAGDEVASTFEDAASNAEDLPTDDPAAFATAASGLGTDLTTGLSDIGEASGDIEDSWELEEAADENDDCQSLEEGPSLPAAPAP